MKKIILAFFMIILPFLGFSQINEGFEGATFPPTTPGNWAVLDNGVGTAVSWTETTDPTRVHSGLKAAIVDRENVGPGNTSQDWLVSPQITVTTNAQLRFFTRQTIVPDNGTTYEIRVSTNASQTNQAAYTTIKTWTDLTLNASPLVYEEKIVSLAAYPAGTQLYIAFVKVNTQPAGPTTGDRWLIDDVKVAEQCLDPTTLNVTNLASVSATLNWTNVGSATQWEIEVLPVASTPTGVGVVTGAPTYSATGLTPGTDYIFYVRSLCSGGVNSAWVSFLFSTKPLGSICVSPIVIGALPYSHTSDTILYGDEVDVPQGTGCAGGATNYLQGYEVFYSYTATTTGNISVTMTPTNTNSSIFVYNGCANVGVTCLGTGVANTTAAPRVIPSLAVVAGQTYVFVISTNATTQSTPYSLVIQEVTCTPPTALTAGNIGTATASLSWTNPTATSWQVAVQPAGSAIPSGPGITANTNINFGVSGLTLGTAYQYWVRSDCGNGTFSPWAGPYLFNTNICEVVDQCTYTFRLASTTAQWSGARMEVRQNGFVVATLGPQFTTGTVLNVPVTLCQNYPFQLVWTVVGTVPTRVNISIINNAPFSQTIYTKPTTVLSLGQLYATSFNCGQAACLDPTNLTSTLITTTTARLGWTPNGSTLWDVYLVPTGSPAPTAASTPTYAGITTNPLDVTLLTQNTTYDFYVRAVCATSNSNWSIVKTFTTLPTCLAPTALTTTAITATTVTVGWTNAGAATSWNCIALPCGSPAPTAASTGWVLATTNSLVMTGLNPGTCYDFYVRGVCSASDTGPWSLVKSAITLPGCGGGFYDTGGPTAIYGNSENSIITICPTNPGDIVTVTFTAFDTEATWDGLYVFDGNTVAAPQIASTNPAGNVPGGLAGSYWGTAIPGPFTSSSVDGCLTFRFRSDTSGTAAGWSANVTCGPPPPCAKPKLLTVSNITQTTAILGWNQPLNPNGSQATTWQVLVLPCGSPAPTAASTGWATATANSYITTGLLPGTCYEYYVRASCSATEVSLWNGPKSFTTLLINDECIGSILAPVNQNTNCLQTVAGTVNAATASPEANSCGATADNDDVWYHFIATATTHHISLLGVNYATNPTGLQYTLYTGSCGAMTQFGGCVTATEANNTTGLTIGQTYYIRVYSTATTASTIQFELCIGTTQITCPTALPLCAITPVIIPNNVGVPTLPNPVSPYSTTSSNVGCLGSAPAPTFYYLTIPTNGNYTFFLEQNSNNTFTGTGLDVDFVAWGPYASTSAACASISTANAFPTGPSAFCSFSAAFTETFTVNSAVAGQVYVLMITNYSQDKGFVRITQTSGPIPSFCCPYTNFSYPGAFFCQNGANIFPTLQSGGTAGTYSSTPGLVINPVTGEINIGASTIGSYTVTNTIPGVGSCTTSTSTWLIKISAPANATIAYSAPAYCSNDAVIKTVTQTGTAGGNYYAVPAGLTINNTTGAINPSTSTPGTYTVNYAIASVAGCPTFLATTTVIITRLPIATFNYGLLPYCQNGGTASPTFTGGGVAGVFTSTAGLVIDPTTGVIDLVTSTPGTYTVTNTIVASGGCNNVVSTNTITITTLPIATFNYAGSPYCQNAGTVSPTFTGGGVAGTFTSTTGLTINSTTGEVDLATSTSGTYVVTNTIPAANGCPSVIETASITINVNPTATIASSDADDTICSNDSATIIVTPTNYTTGATYSWTLGGNPIAGTTNTVPVTTTGTYAVTITLNGCTNVTPLSLAFTVNPLPSFTLSGTNIVKCLNETAVLSVVPTNFSLTDPTITYSWTLDGNPLSNTTSSINVLAYGTYAVTVNNAGCTTTHQINVTLDTADIPIGTNGECVGINYILTASPVNGSFTPGVGNVSYVWTNGSGTAVGTNDNTFNVSEYVRNNPSTTFPSIFTVTITTIPEGCTDSQSFVVESSVCTIQKGISPNGDGDNDYFDLRGLNVKQLEIFNRYGKKVYSLANYTNQWKGQSDKGQELPDGTYYYVIDQNNGETKTGWIYINK
ncbi:fibronectin type III domain-containing protein [Flavobacterium sp.]|uniref:fibronectin type III domain-containing protein n=1 Tax=Flavobacterium sp. TaxID=239 RepID=UPI0038FC4192